MTEDQRERAQCPYCYEGWIVQEKISDVFYCAICKREVQIKQV